MPTRNKQNRGFTVVESLVAIAILVTVIAGISSAVRTSISSSTFSRDQIIAFYLAQEAFEQIRNMRDENALNNRGWLTGITANSGDPCFFGNACIVDPLLSNIPTRCPAPGSCPVIRQQAASKFFGYDPTWTASIFRREIVLASVNANEITLTVTVDWSKGSVDRQFRAKENIFNWQ